MSSASSQFRQSALPLFSWRVPASSWHLLTWVVVPTHLLSTLRSCLPRGPIPDHVQVLKHCSWTSSPISLSFKPYPVLLPEKPTIPSSSTCPSGSQALRTFALLSLTRPADGHSCSLFIYACSRSSSFPCALSEF